MNCINPKQQFKGRAGHTLYIYLWSMERGRDREEGGSPDSPLPHEGRVGERRMQHDLLQAKEPLVMILIVELELE
jgi:hypothetical protein